VEVRKAEVASGTGQEEEGTGGHHHEGEAIAVAIGEEVVDTVHIENIVT